MCLEVHESLQKFLKPLFHGGDTGSNPVGLGEQLRTLVNVYEHFTGAYDGASLNFFFFAIYKNQRQESSVRLPWTSPPRTYVEGTALELLVC
jgi:hypothetical protein